MRTKPLHLGDGVYIQHDTLRGGIILTTGSHLVDEADNVIYMGAMEVAAFVAYVKPEIKVPLRDPESIIEMHDNSDGTMRFGLNKTMRDE